MCVENIKEVISWGSEQKQEIKFGKIVNAKFHGRTNYLHNLIAELDDSNFHTVSEVIKILIDNGCSPNLLSDEKETPFYKLLQCPVSDTAARNDLINYVLTHSDVNTRSNKEIPKLMLHLGITSSETKIETNELDYLRQQLSDENEEEFLEHFGSFKNAAALPSLLEVAIAQSLDQIVELLINSGVDVNEVPEGSRYIKEPAFLAASLGQVNIFAILLKQPELEFDSHTSKRNLLHEIISSENVEPENIVDLFTMVVTDRRCTSDMLNSLDNDDKSPLSYACIKGHDIVITELLRRGAYIGTSSAMENLKPNVLESFLDECLTRKQDGKICIDYQFMLPPSATSAMEPISKVNSLKDLAENPNLKHLLKHPVVSSFLDLNWNQIKYTIYVVSMLHFFCLAFEVWTMAYFLKHSANFSDAEQVFFVMLFVFLFLSMILLESYEIITSFKTYFFKLGNWLDLLMIGTIIYAVIESDKDSAEAMMSDLQRAGAFLILFVAGQCIKIVGASIYTTMFRKVCSTFLKLIAMYSFIFLTFALSFHIIFNAEQMHDPNPSSLAEQGNIHLESPERRSDDNSSLLVLDLGIGSLVNQFNETLLGNDESNETTQEPNILESSTTMMPDVMNQTNQTTLTFNQRFKTFDNVYISVYRVIGMFAGELSSDQFEDPLKMTLLVLFIFFITITLQNLMNSMAIIDTQEIIKEAEIIGLKKTVMMVHQYENFFSMIFTDYLRMFPERAINKYLIDTSDRSLKLYEPLKFLSEQKSSKKEKQRKYSRLRMSKNSLENVEKYLESLETAEEDRELICSKCSLKMEKVNDCLNSKL